MRRNENTHTCVHTYKYSHNVRCVNYAICFDFWTDIRLYFQEIEKIIKEDESEVEYVCEAKGSDNKVKCIDYIKFRFSPF